MRPCCFVGECITKLYILPKNPPFKSDIYYMTDHNYAEEEQALMFGRKNFPRVPIFVWVAMESRTVLAIVWVKIRGLFGQKRHASCCYMLGRKGMLLVVIYVLCCLLGFSLENPPAETGVTLYQPTNC